MIQNRSVIDWGQGTENIDGKYESSRELDGMMGKSDKWDKMDNEAEVICEQVKVENFQK